MKIREYERYEPSNVYVVFQGKYTKRNETENRGEYGWMINSRRSLITGDGG